MKIPSYSSQGGVAMHSVPINDEGLIEARVLVVDDDPVVRAQLQQVVAGMVTEVHAADDGLTGLALWRGWNPDLVVTDIMMPIMDGLVMSKAIRREDASAQIVVVTSSSEAQHLRQALDIGIDRYVLKPVDKRLLEDAIFKCLKDLYRQRELKLARLVFESTTEGVVVTDDQHRILAVNPAFSEITGYREDEAMGRKASLMASGKHDAAFYHNMEECLRSLGRWSGEIVNRRKSGELYSEWLSIVAVEQPGKRGMQFIGLFSDITERKREEDNIRRLAHFDSLTGLPNRILLMDRLKRAMSRVGRRGEPLGVLYLDLDRFKPVNDQYGHAFGDLVLIQAAERMVDCVRDVDMVSRRGGDEFIIVLDVQQDLREGVALVARKLIDAVSQPYRIEGREVSIGASIGVAIYPYDGDDMESLLEAADAALYAAKREGRGNYRFYRHEDQQVVNARLSLEDALRRGNAEGRFELRYLPEISLASGRVERIEMLLRFRHPDHGVMEARRFLDLAEELGLLTDLGLKMLAQAVWALASNEIQHVGLTMDMSARQLAALGGAQPIIEALAGLSLPREALTFEFTERAVTGNEVGLKTLYSLANAGFRCSLDDFGAGYCSFALLQQLPLSSIKIDMSFIEEIDQVKQSRELVAALLAFGKRLGLRTVAEGVNTPTQLAFLRENGCDAVQGYLFGEPLESTELQAYLSAQSWLALL